MPDKGANAGRRAGVQLTEGFGLWCRHERNVMSDELQMWAINVEGPDDLVAAPTKAEADAACTLLNAAFGRNKALHDMGVKAVVVPWNLAYEQWRASQETEFLDLLSADLERSVKPAAVTDEARQTFEEAARPLIKWMAENLNPHTHAVVDSNSAEIVESVHVLKTDDYLVD
jgi:hypothetical protein